MCSGDGRPTAPAYVHDDRRPASLQEFPGKSIRPGKEPAINPPKNATSPIVVLAPQISCLGPFEEIQESKLQGFLSVRRHLIR